MMLTGQKEWIAIALLIAYIAFVPCPYAMKQFFSSSLGKVVALGVFVGVFKYVSEPVALLMLVNYLRSGAIREYLEGDTGMTPTVENNFNCPSEFIYDSAKKTCAKGTETKSPICVDSLMMFDAMQGKCMAKPSSTPPAVGASADMPPSVPAGPPGGTSPGSMAAMNDMANSTPGGSPPSTTEGFTPYDGKKDKGEFAPI